MTDLGAQLNKLDKSIAKRQTQRTDLLSYDEFLKLQAKVVANPDLSRKQLGETCLDVLNVIARRLKYKYTIPLAPGEVPVVNIADAKICKEMLDVTEYTGRKQDVPVSQINVKKTLIVNVQKSAQELEDLLKDVVDI